ncbi:MAG: hypothetical protein ACLQJ0_14450 [Steroidobacteraceae bacterium]|jgi:hypothetical protein
MSEKPSLSLDARLAQLPRDMAPERDLWPEIEVRLTHGARNQRRRHFALGLAAGLAAMALALLAAFHPRAVLAPRAVSARIAQTPESAGPRDAAFVRTQAALERSFKTDLQRLPPQTQTRVLQDLEIIRNARADIRSALDANPQDPLLHELLADTWQQEMDFYANVSSTTDSARMRWPL